MVDYKSLSYNLDNCLHASCHSHIYCGSSDVWLVGDPPLPFFLPSTLFSSDSLSPSQLQQTLQLLLQRAHDEEGRVSVQRQVQLPRQLGKEE